MDVISKMRYRMIFTAGRIVIKIQQEINNFIIIQSLSKSILQRKSWYIDITYFLPWLLQKKNQEKVNRRISN